MILKLRTGIKENCGWRLIGGIKSVSYDYIDEPKKYGILDDYINVFPDVKDKRITKIIMVFENGEGKMIYTDDIVYILNDNGKTCDTINI